MLYVTSSIYEASLKPLELLRDFATSSWNLDLQRLLDHASLKSIAFSGKRFFFITRPLILAVRLLIALKTCNLNSNRNLFQMAGTIITYELVLLDQVAKDQDTTRDCDF